MKLLIVDDSHSKVEKIAAAIAASGISVNLVHETNAASARQKLQQEEFDLLFIDLLLPEVAGATPNQKGGLNFFDMIVKDKKTKLPSEILFVTQEDSLIVPGQQEVALRGSALCIISNNANNWMPTIIGRINLANQRSLRKNARCDVAIITALGSELDAVRKLPYGWEQFRLPGDPTLYHRGSIETAIGARSIIAATALRKGMAASSSLSTKLILKFQPKILAMTGICAGVRSKTNLGDVIIASPTWDWGSGKHAETDDGSPVFRLAPKQSDLNNELATLCDEISRSADFKSRIRANWDRPVPSGGFACHVGPMASGASVIANVSTANEISRQNKDLIAIEMEAFSVMIATEYATTSQTLGIAIKSVCDYADNEKADDWQSYASYTSAAFANELFLKYFSNYS